MATSKKAANDEPSLRFYHSKALRQKTLKVLNAIAAQPDQAENRETLADLVNELIDAGMDYYFIRALKNADVGFMAEQSAKLGMSAAVKILSSMTRKFIVRMDQQQLLTVSVHIRALT